MELSVSCAVQSQDVYFRFVSNSRLSLLSLRWNRDPYNKLYFCIESKESSPHLNMTMHWEIVVGFHAKTECYLCLGQASPPL